MPHNHSTRGGRRRGLPLLAAATILPAAMAALPRPAHAAVSTISLVRSAAPCAAGCFVPGAPSVAAGDRVVFADPAQLACTLRPTSGPDPAFRGGPLPGYAYTFTVAGMYGFRCAEHPEVHGTLGVVGPVLAAKQVVAKPPATAADPLPALPPSRDHTPGYVPILLSIGGIALALLISQLGTRLRWI